MERGSVFGWVPEAKAGNAREAWELMLSTLLDGIERSYGKRISNMLSITGIGIRTFL